MHGGHQDGEPFQCLQGFEPTMLKDWQWEDNSNWCMSLMDVMNGNMCGGANKEWRMKPGSVEELDLSSVG